MALHVLLGGALLAGCGEPRAPAPIAGASGAGIAGSAGRARPLAGAVPPHPELGAAGYAAMHADTYNSDVHPGPGPLGRAPVVRSRSGSRGIGGECATHVVDRDGRLLVLCGRLFGFSLQLLDPISLELLAHYPLPGRPSTVRALLSADPDKIMSDTSGAYFYLDRKDRVVIADSRAVIRRIAHRRTGAGDWIFEDADRWDLGAIVFEGCGALDRWMPWKGCDALTAVLPDFAGRIWWVTRGGRVGTLDPATGAVRHLRLDGEEIQNGFAVAEDGVYIVSDHALYRFAAGPDGSPVPDWREPYDRGSARKSGSINQGSGTTPTLIGERYVTITDNADERINLLVYRRDPAFAGERLICREPLFAPGASSTDNSPIGWGRSIVVENNFGYRNALAETDWGAIPGGITRIDIRRDESGCDVVWHSSERAPSVVSKLSAETGLIYSYGFEPSTAEPVAWQLVAIDFDTGRTQFRIPTGSGRNFDNNWASISLGPDGSAYVGTLKGLLAVRDGH